MNAYKVGQRVTLNNGTEGTIKEVYRASEKGAQRDMGFYLFANAVNGTTFTVGHTEIARATAQVSDDGLDTLAYAQSMLNTHPDNSPFWDSSAGQDVLAVAKQNNLAATNTNRQRAAIHTELMQQAQA